MPETTIDAADLRRSAIANLIRRTRLIAVLRRVEPHARLLELDPVVHLRRLRCADDRPMAIESSVLIGATAPIVLAADLEDGSLHEALATGGFRLRRGTGTIEAQGASDEDARLLGLEGSRALLVERRVISDIAGRPIEATESRYRGDRYALDVTFDVEEPG